MRIYLNAIIGLPHAEERSGAAGAHLEARTAPDAGVYMLNPLYKGRTL
jgi:hypothetical protein